MSHADNNQSQQDGRKPALARASGSTFRLGFFGSRTLWDERVITLIREEIHKHNPTNIVTSGETGGVCKEARIAAKALSIPLTVHFLNFGFRAGAFEKRSRAILADCDHMVLIHDGKSQGTANELNDAKRMGVPFTYHQIEVEEQTKDPRNLDLQCTLF